MKLPNPPPTYTRSRSSGRSPWRLQEQVDARPNRPGGQLQLAEVALGKQDRPAVGRFIRAGKPKRRLAVVPDYPAGQIGRHAGWQFIGQQQASLRGQEAVPEQFGGSVDQGRAAKAGRRHVADDIDPQAVIDDDFFDCPFGGRACPARCARPRRPDRRPSKRRRTSLRPPARSRRWCRYPQTASDLRQSISPVANMPATVSPPTNPPMTGMIHARPRG